jgi:hypothetical protein
MPTMDAGELTKLIENSAAETRRHVDAAAEETRRHFDVVADEMKRQVQLAAEEFVHLGAKLDREGSDLREEMKRGFLETQAMIKFSYSELDRRCLAT